MIPIILWEEISEPVGGIPSLFRGLAWIVGWNIATLRLGCDVLSYVILCISLITFVGNMEVQSVHIVSDGNRMRQGILSCILP